MRREWRGEEVGRGRERREGGGMGGGRVERGERKGKVGSGRSLLAGRSVKERFEEMEYALT